MRVASDEYRPIYDKAKAQEEAKAGTHVLPPNFTEGILTNNLSLPDGTVYKAGKHIKKRANGGGTTPEWDAIQAWDGPISINRSKGHIHNRAGRKMVKLWIAHIWTTWRQLEGLPIRDPYVQTHLGHDGIIPPPVNALDPDFQAMLRSRGLR